MGQCLSTLSYKRLSFKQFSISSKYMIVDLFQTLQIPPEKQYST